MGVLGGYEWADICPKTPLWAAARRMSVLRLCAENQSVACFASAGGVLGSWWEPAQSGGSVGWFLRRFGW